MNYFLLFLLFLGLLIFANSNQNIELNKKVIDFCMKNIGTRNFSLEINSTNYISNNYLVFDLVGYNFSDPDIFISSDKTGIDGKPFHLGCTDFGNDICIISPPLVGGKYNISIVCYNDCNFSLIVLYAKENVISGRYSSSGIIGAEGILIYKYNIPNNSSIEDITMKLIIYTYFTTKVNMKVRSANSSLFYSQPIPVFGGYVFKAKKGSYDFCIDCDYIIIIKSFETTEFNFAAFTSKEVQEITSQSNNIIDVIENSYRNCYFYEVKSNNTNLIVSMQVFSGNPDIFVNPGYTPSSLSDFRFSTNGTSDEELVITPKERRDLELLTGKYYICIAGYTSAYELSVYEGGYRNLRNGLTYTSEVDKNELLVYAYYVTYLHDIIFSLFSFEGNADLYIKSCRDQNYRDFDVNTCILTINNLNSVNYSRKLEGPDIIRVNYSSINCSEYETCYILVGILGVSHSTTTFSIEAHDINFQMITLYENELYTSYVDLKGYQYFAFSNIENKTFSVLITLETLTGDSDLYVSRKTKFCNLSNSEKYSLSTYFEDQITYDKSDGNLTGNYYISVFGYMKSLFRIKYNIIRNNDKEENITMLEEDTAIKINLPSNQTSHVFSIKILNDSSNKINKINKRYQLLIHPFFCSYKILGSKNVIPNSDNYTYYSESNIINFDSNNETKIFYFRIIKKEQNENCSFSINYYENKISDVLSDGIMRISEVSSLNYTYYKYYITDLSQSLKISIASLGGIGNMYISLGTINTVPSSTNFTIKSEPIINSITLRINKYDLERYYSSCEYNFNFHECTVYISVKAISSHFYYSISVGQSLSGLIKLESGISQSGRINDSEVAYFYFKPKLLDDISISLQSSMSYSEIYASISNENLSRSIIMPNSNNSMFKSEGEELIKSLEISKDNFRNCTNCIILIAVISRYYISDYTISISEKIAELFEGEAILGYVNESQYKYYNFIMTCFNCSLTISLFPINDCNPDLYVNKNYPPFPTKNSSDFFANDFGGEYFNINLENHYFDRRLKSMIGNYAIGVYAEEFCNYFIAATTSLSEINSLSFGIPLMVYQKIKYRTFVFHYNGTSKLTIYLDILKGNPIIRGNSILEPTEENIIQNLPITNEKAFWTNQEAAFTDTISIYPDDKNYLHFGYYLFVSECNNNCQFSIEAFDNNSIPLISMNKQIILNMKKNYSEKYYFLNNLNKPFTIFTTSIKGKYKIYVSKSKKVSPNDYSWNSSENSQIFVDFSEKNKLMGSFYILIEPTIDSIFSLLIYNGKRVIQLREGMPFHYIYDGINLNATSLFYDLRHDNNNNDEPITIGISIKRISKGFVPHIYIKSTKVFDDFPNITSYHQRVRFPEDFEKEYYTYIKSNNSFITITVDPIFFDGSKVRQGELELTIFSDQSIILREDDSIEASISQELDYKIFNIFSNYADNATITITSCSGRFDYEILKQYSPSNYTKVHKDNPKPDSFINRELINNFEGKYSVNVKARKLGTIFSEGTEESKALFNIQYKLNQPLTSPSHIRQIRFEDKNGIIFIEWDSAIQKELKGQDSFINYTIYVTEMKDTIFETKCGIKYSNPLLIATVANATKFNFQNPYQDDFKLNILANINDQEEIIYKSIIIIQNTPKSGILRFLSLLYFLGVISLFVFTCALYSRINKNEHSSDYELIDLREESDENLICNSNKKELLTNN